MRIYTIKTIAYVCITNIYIYKHTVSWKLSGGGSDSGNIHEMDQEIVMELTIHESWDMIFQFSSIAVIDDQRVDLLTSIHWTSTSWTWWSARKRMKMVGWPPWSPPSTNISIIRNYKKPNKGQSSYLEHVWTTSGSLYVSLTVYANLVWGPNFCTQKLVGWAQSLAECGTLGNEVYSKPPSIS